jgi:hypothetical protein
VDTRTSNYPAWVGAGEPIPDDAVTDRAEILRLSADAPSDMLAAIAGYVRPHLVDRPWNDGTVRRVVDAASGFLAYHVQWPISVKPGVGG